LIVVASFLINIKEITTTTIIIIKVIYGYMEIIIIKVIYGYMEIIIIKVIYGYMEIIIIKVIYWYMEIITTKVIHGIKEIITITTKITHWSSRWKSCHSKFSFSMVVTVLLFGSIVMD